MDWSSAPIQVPKQPILTLEEVAVAVGYHKKTIERWIKDGTFPASKRIGGGQRWTNMSVGVWLAWQSYCPCDDAGVDNEEDTDEPPESKGAVKGK